MTGKPLGSSALGSEDGWDGTVGRHWVEHEERHDRMLVSLTARLLDAAGISPEDKVLDVGCGCAETSRAAARQASAGEVLGVDISGPMLAQARGRAEDEHLANLRFEQADAESADLPGTYFDLALSRFGVMFFGDAKAAFVNIARALRPGGRLAFLCWQEVGKNEHIVVPFSVLVSFGLTPDIGGPGTPGPFSLADPGRIRELLGEAGCTDIEIEPVNERLPFGSDVPDVLTYFRGHPVAAPLIAGMDEATLARLMDELGKAVLPFQTPDGVYFGSSAWLVTARR
ncbi:2-methoxy-6-polyprenyl-1,4-benzoquinol methylase [Actinomadura sp. RB99]|uniref:class I SAM-dependent methyltransferase n=1 Tax=Actinomadura sp. RB99 TaxID=2691577 RepID=UPI0016854A0E|nr:class I SAM-dependent methyltransferase [Actinomadura sp. RB99]MBD2892609.1 2-methoxy-6-polyprenyl-1,4-benzoquinol methylase [Actinomadura sp. RB99]